MIFEISIQPETQDQESPKPLQIQAADWVTAMREGLPKMGTDVANRELEVTLLNDERSAVVYDQLDKRKIFVLAVEQQLEGFLPLENKEEISIEASEIPGSTKRAHARFITQPIPVVPSIKPDTFSLTGAYVEGTTTDFLTEAFMKVGDLYGNFGDDLDGAMEHLFAMLCKATKAAGGGLLLEDINDPQGHLRFAFATGPQKEDIETAAISSKSGAVAHCIQQTATLQVDDIAGMPFARPEPLCEAGLHAGPVLLVPILQPDQGIAGVVLLYKIPQSTPFAKAEVNIFAYLSDAIAQYLHLRHQSLQN